MPDFLSEPLNWVGTVIVLGVSAFIVKRTTSILDGAWVWTKGLALRRHPFLVARLPAFVSHASAFMDVPSWVLPHEQQVLPPPPAMDKGDLARARWARALGGVDARWTSVEFTVTGTDDAAVVIHGIEVKIVKRAPPIQGTHVIYGGGDLAAVRWVEVDLDGSPPSIARSTDNRFLVVEGEENTVGFPYTVAKGSTETFFLLAKTRKHYCEWTAELIFTCGAHHGRYKIDDGGRPFRTTASTSADTYISRDGATFVRHNDGADEW